MVADEGVSALYPTEEVKEVLSEAEVALYGLVYQYLEQETQTAQAKAQKGLSAILTSHKVPPKTEVTFDVLPAGGIALRYTRPIKIVPESTGKDENVA